MATRAPAVLGVEAACQRQAHNNKLRIIKAWPPGQGTLEDFLSFVGRRVSLAGEFQVPFLKFSSACWSGCILMGTVKKTQSKLSNDRRF